MIIVPTFVDRSDYRGPELIIQKFIVLNHGAKTADREGTYC
jgi:hypothetical protein